MPRHTRGGYKPKAGAATSGRDEVVTSATGGGASNRSTAAQQTDARQKGKSRPLTHFLCFPLINETSKTQLEESLARFRKGLSAGENGYDVPEKAIRPLGTLHLTLGVMSLEDRTKVESAIALLKEINVIDLLREAEQAHLHKESQGAEATGSSNTATTPGRALHQPASLQLSLRGLESMHPVQKTSVLYAPPHDQTARVQVFGEALRTRFAVAGFMASENRPLRLHATIINTIYAKNSGGVTSSKQRAGPNTSRQNDGHGEQSNAGRHGRDSRGFIKLDATTLVDHFSDFEWAKDITLQKVAICKMGAKKILGKFGDVIGEEYEEVTSVLLPI